MEYPTVPTLKNIATIKLAVVVCSDPEVEKFLKRVSSVDLYKEWQQLIDSKMSKLLIPIDLQKAVSAIASRVGLQIRDKNLYFYIMHWKISSVFGVHCLCLDEIFPSIYRWTPEGYIDMINTVRAIVGDHRVDQVFRFSLSSNYGLGNEAMLIWDEMSDAMKDITMLAMSDTNSHTGSDDI